MTGAPCIRCARPVADVFVCSSCIDRARVHLAEIAFLVPDVRAIARRLAHLGAPGVGGKPEARLPIHDGVTDMLAEIQNDLNTLVRMVEEERGAATVSAALGDRLVPDPLTRAAKLLSGQMNWLRGHAAADEALDIIGTCARRMRSVVDGPDPGRYAGRCSTLVEDSDGSARECAQDLVARSNSTVAKCRACGAKYDVDEQQAWMRSEVEGYLARPVEIRGLLMRLGFEIGYSTVARYVAKGQVVAHGSDEKGRPLYRIGDIMNARMGEKMPRNSQPRTRGNANLQGG